jgi:hypothetical protein
MRNIIASGGPALGAAQECFEVTFKGLVAVSHLVLLEKLLKSTCPLSEDARCAVLLDCIKFMRLAGEDAVDTWAKML